MSEQETSDQRNTAVDQTTSGQDRPPSADILIVDDTVANLHLLSGLLKEEGYHVRPVTNGQLALTAAQKKCPDLVLLDINMPEMDGYEVCARLKRDETLRAVPVIFISALSDPLDKVKAFKCGGVDYVTKPFQIEEVRARVDTHLRLARMTDRLSQQNAALTEKNRRLSELTQLTENLTGLIIHDLRAPLSGIMGYLELLQINSVGQLNDDYREDIDKALAVAMQMNETISALMDVTRLEKADMPIQKRRCDITELADEAMTSLESIAEYRHLNVDFPGDGVYANCDPSLIRRVIVNLLHNALKVTSRDGKVLLTARTEEDEVYVGVKDDGPGISEEFTEHLFDKFGQTALRSIKGRSPGLGLAFCKMCIEAHGGKIGAHRGENGGSVLWFRLPATGQ